MLLLDLGFDMLSGALRKASDDRMLNEQIQTIEEQQENLTAAYQRESAKDYLDTTEGKSAMGALNSVKDEQEEALANNVARNSATAEAAVALGAEVNKNYSDAVSKLAAVGTERQSALDESYSDAMSDLNDRKNDLAEERESFWSYIF